MATTAERFPIPPPPFSKSKVGKRTTPVAGPEASIEVEELPEEHIIYINDDADLSPLSLLETQVDCVLMPPPVDATPIAQRLPLPPRMDQQPPKVLEMRIHPSGAVGKKTLQEGRKGKPLKLNIPTVAKMCTDQLKYTMPRNWPGWPVPWLPSKSLTYKRIPMSGSPKLHQSSKHPPFPKISEKVTLCKYKMKKKNHFIQQIY